MADSDTLPFRHLPKSRHVAGGDQGDDEEFGPGDAYANIKGQRQSLDLRFHRHGRFSFAMPYGYMPIPWWDGPTLLLLEYPGIYTVALRGKNPVGLMPLLAERRLTWIRECDPAADATLPIAVFRIDILSFYPSREWFDIDGFDLAALRPVAGG